jgi:putative ABC transport system ATP-binding protein
MFRFEQVTYKDIIDIREMTIPSGLTALVGPSGSGKTTLLRLMNKLVTPSYGIIYYQGMDLSEIPAVEHRRKVMMLSQNPILFPGNIRDNLNVGFKFQKKEAPKDQRLMEILQQVQLEKDLDGPVESLSGGERQRLVLARVCLLEPEVYLLDEPSAALDDVSEDAIVSMLSRYTKEKGTSAVMVTHARSVAEKYCDEIIELKKEVNHG